jgi:hypothetical protein
MAKMVNSNFSCHNSKFTTASLANRRVFYKPTTSASKGFCNNFEYFLPYLQVHEYGCTCRNVFGGTWLNKYGMRNVSVDINFEG